RCSTPSGCPRTWASSRSTGASTSANPTWRSTRPPATGSSSREPASSVQREHLLDQLQPAGGVGVGEEVDLEAHLDAAHARDLAHHAVALGGEEAAVVGGRGQAEAGGLLVPGVGDPADGVGQVLGLVADRRGAPVRAYLQEVGP